MDLEKAKEALEAFTGQAEQLIKDPGKLEELLRQFEAKIKELPVAGDALSRVPLMISMIRSYITREYTAVSPKVIVTLVAAIMYLCIVEGHNAALPEIAMIGVAAFTFYNVATAAITATRTRRGNLRQQTMLRVSVAGTIGAMLMLEMQMFGTYARLATPQLVAVMETVTGGVGALLVLLMGCSLLSKLRRVDKSDE
jgi:hypothetical protein